MSKISKMFKSYSLTNSLKEYPKKSDFKLTNGPVRTLKNGEYLAEAVYLKVSPHRQAIINKNDDTCGGIQIAKIIESQNANFPINKYVVGDFGWRTLTVVDEAVSNTFQPFLVPELEGLPKSLALGPLGIPGLAAYFGLIEICKPKENDVVVVSTAGGSVGHIVGQIAKIKKCRVIGITSSDEKGKWLTDELHFDHFINYKNDDIQVKLKEYAPNGVDCYFDNVGGQISSDVIYQMKTFGRICICGATSLYYSNDSSKKGSEACEVQTPIKIKHVKMEGMHVTRWSDRWTEGIKQNLQWIQEGKLKCKETVTNGFENTIEAFINTLEGKTCGTAIVKV